TIHPEQDVTEEPVASAKVPTYGVSGRIAVRDDAADLRLFQDVALDAGDEEVLLFSQVGGARPPGEQADVIVPCLAGQLRPRQHRNFLALEQPDPPAEKRDDVGLLALIQEAERAGVRQEEGALLGI